MGNFLHKFGEYSFSHKWRILLIWVVLLVIAGLAAIKFMTPVDMSVSIPGTQAQKALDRFSSLFPDAGKASGRIVFATAGDKTINDYKTQINDVISSISKVSKVTSVTSPFDNTAAISSSKNVAYAPVQIDSQVGAVSTETSSKVNSIVKQYANNGLEIEMGGDLTQTQVGELLGPGEISGVVLALVVLVITLGSLVAAGMPLIVALFAIGVSIAGLFSLGHVIDISSTTPALAVMLGLAVGIDYSLFIINRYKALLLEGYGYQEAAGRAIATAGNAVIFAASTVVIALASLSIVQIPFMTTMGLAAAATVAIAALVSISLIPALLGMVGRHVFVGKTGRLIKEAQAVGPHHTEHVKHRTFWHHWGTAITKRPVRILVVAVAVIVAVALPVSQLKLGLPIDQYAAKTSTQRKAYDLVSKGFGIGYNAPLLIVVEGVPSLTAADKEAVRAPIMAAYNKQVAAATAAQTAAFQAQAAEVKTQSQAASLQQAIATTKAEGETQQRDALNKINQEVDQYAQYYQLTLIANRMKNVANVEQAQAILTTDNGTKGVIQVIPKTAPSDQKTIDLINYFRSSKNQNTLTKSTKISFAVTGSTALQTDINEKLSMALPEYLAVVVGLSFILLVIAFRSILVPVKATLGFLLSVLAMFGAMVAVFQWGWLGVTNAPGPIVSFIPIIAIGILFGLAMDYEFFLVSNMHEAHLHTGDSKKAVVRGFSIGSKVVTAAAIIMVSVFAGFITNQDSIIRSIGFALALGIFVDAFIVRMTIVPAVMTLLGDKAWWVPKWLDRVLPHLSIEGSDKPKSQ